MKKDRPTLTKFIEITANEGGFKLMPYQKELAVKLLDSNIKKIELRPCFRHGYTYTKSLIKKVNQIKSESIK